MAKNKKRKKTPAQPEVGGYKRFLIDMHETLCLMHIHGDFSGLSNEFKRTAYNYKIGILNPTAGNEGVSSGELKMFAERSKKEYRERTFQAGDMSCISSYQLQLYYAFISARLMEIQKETGDKMHPMVIVFKNSQSQILRAFLSRYLACYFKMITRLSNPDQKYYGADIRMAPFIKEKLKMEFICEVFGFHPQKCMISVNGCKRPAFQLAKPFYSMKTPVVWISIDVSLLGDFYKGSKNTLDVFIQSHALTRMKERLDLLDQEAINYALWENTQTIKEFERFNGYLLLPFKVFGIKIGYLVANVIEDKLLFRTFLFITHNSSPEGTRLRKLTGLGKEDITYWKIDRLSTFVKLKAEKYPGLIQLFCKAGLEKLMELKDKEFTIDSMQAANLDGLSEYITRGKNELKLMNLNLDTLVNEIDRNPGLTMSD